MFNNTSDLLMGVVAAANPVKYQDSLHKLQLAQRAGKISQPIVISQDSFQNLLANENISSAASSSNVASSVPVTNNAKAYKAFEAFMLQSFVENMFTSDSSKVFGKGQSGKIWRSMMSEAIAKEMAENGGIGIANILAKQEEVKEQEVIALDDKQEVGSLFSEVKDAPANSLDSSLRNIYVHKQT